MPALLTFTVSVDGPADARLRRFRVSLPRAPKWERARTGQLLELLITRALACDASAPRSSAHLATMRGPIGNDEPLRAHVCTGDEVRLCEGEAPRGESTSLWMWGEGGQLGKVSALSGVNVTAIALGSSHAAVLTGSGLVLTWGANDYGQLGTGDEVAHSAPRVVSALARSARVRLLACGPRYTAVVSAAGELYTWGQNQPSSTPSRFYDSWLNAGAREHADERRRLREWQQAREGELGGGQDAGGAQPQLDSCCGLGVRELACGTEHMAIVDEAGEIYLWGYNDQGQCGLQRGQLRSATRFLGLQKPRAPLQLPSHPSTPFALRPLRVACGAAHTLVLTSDHQLFGFGCNTCGQLGLAERTTRLLPTRVPWDDRSAPIVDVIAAGHATMVRLADGRALLLGRLAAGSGNGFLPLMPPVGRREGGGANDAAAGNDDGGGEDAGGNGGGGNGGDGDGEPSRAAAGFELPSLPLAVSDNVMRMAMSDAHVLMQAAGDSSILGFGYNRYHQASVHPLPGDSSFVHPHQPARSATCCFEWDAAFAMAAGGGQSALLTRDRHRSLQDKCELVLLSQLAPCTAAPLLDAALRTHARLLLRGCVALVEQHGVAHVLAQSEPEYAMPPPQDASGELAAVSAPTRFERALAEARAMIALDDEEARPAPMSIDSHA